MGKRIKVELLTFVASIVLIGLFGYSAMSKILEHEKFVFQMSIAPVPLMATFAPLLSWVVPIVEIGIVLLLLFNQWRKAGLIASALLLAVFEIYISAMLLSGLDLPCTCGGIISKMTWTNHLIFNALFILLALIPVLIERSHSKPSNIPYIEM